MCQMWCQQTHSVALVESQASRGGGTDKSSDHTGECGIVNHTKCHPGERVLNFAFTVIFLNKNLLSLFNKDFIDKFHLPLKTRRQNPPQCGPYRHRPGPSPPCSGPPAHPLTPPCQLPRHAPLQSLGSELGPVIICCPCLKITDNFRAQSPHFPVALGPTDPVARPTGTGAGKAFSSEALTAPEAKGGNRAEREAEGRVVHSTRIGGVHYDQSPCQIVAKRGLGGASTGPTDGLGPHPPHTLGQHRAGPQDPVTAAG